MILAQRMAQGRWQDRSFSKVHSCAIFMFRFTTLVLFSHALRENHEEDTGADKLAVQNLEYEVQWYIGGQPYGEPAVARLWPPGHIMKGVPCPPPVEAWKKEEGVIWVEEATWNLVLVGINICLYTPGEVKVETGDEMNLVMMKDLRQYKPHIGFGKHDGQEVKLYVI